MTVQHAEIDMERDALASLNRWCDDPFRKPLVIRGARQVGKSWLVRRFGRQFDGCAEVNFEFEPAFGRIFDRDLDPVRILRDLSIALGTRIVPGETLLFLDEIQECPRALTALRYFHERMSRQHVIAAGSLLDFTVERIGVPVGRVDFLHVYPMSFPEFLSATGNDRLRSTLEHEHDPREPLPGIVHDGLMDLLGQYMAVGGMPEAVARWIETGDIVACSRVHETLVGAYRQDALKYSRKNQRPYVDIVLEAIPRLLGRKFVYSAVASEVRSRTLRSALELLVKAQVAHRVHHTASNGLPLGAEKNPKLFKVVPLDIALAQSILGLDPGPWILDPASTLVNRGPVAEAFVGQELLAHGGPHRRAELFYWVRDKTSSKAEVDYVIASGQHIVPVEVKSGKTGKLKSMHLFLRHKPHSPLGLQLSAENFSRSGPVHRYPLYAVSTALRAIGS